MSTIFDNTPEYKKFPKSPSFPNLPEGIMLIAGQPNCGSQCFGDALCQNLKDGGFNAASGIIGINDIEISLERCAKYGILLFLWNATLRQSKEACQKFVTDRMDLPGLGGWFIPDIISFNQINNESE